MSRLVIDFKVIQAECKANIWVVSHVIPLPSEFFLNCYGISQVCWFGYQYGNSIFATFSPDQEIQ